jgi:hypothetical protein
MSTLRCWEAGPLVDDGCPTTCVLVRGHNGPHEWTRDDRVTFSFASAVITAHGYEVPPSPPLTPCCAVHPDACPMCKRPWSEAGGRDLDTACWTCGRPTDEVLP